MHAFWGSWGGGGWDGGWMISSIQWFFFFFFFFCKEMGHYFLPSGTIYCQLENIYGFGLLSKS